MFPHIGRSSIPALVLGALCLNGCTSWRVQSVPVARLIEAEAPGRIRVDHANGTRMILDWPAVVGDSIRSPGVRVALSDVTAYAVRRVDPVKVLAWTFGILAAGRLFCEATDCLEVGPGFSFSPRAGSL